jgi:S-DNA-T family DNA segregation ATPase FtsK/SpoIIIE
MGGIAFKAFMKNNGAATNDSGKIQRIFSLSGLNVKDGKNTLTTQLIRKKEFEWGTEYKYRIPLGRSFEDYLNKQKTLEDGLNNRRQKVTMEDLKKLQLDQNIINNVKTLFNNKITHKKELEISFDGLLTLRIYNEPLSTTVNFKPGEGWNVPVGLTRDKNVFKFHDFEKIPHMVLGGATTYGKSNFINSLIISLLQSNPIHTHLFLVDLKGGVELCDYENIKQTVSIAYEPEEALITLRDAYDKMRSVQNRLRSLGKKNVREAGIKERYFVIVDEVGELNPLEKSSKEDKELKQQCQTYMSHIARLGASLGFRIILATQYPTADTLPRAVKQNADAKLCFRVQSEVASRVVLDQGGAENLPQIKGRAIYQTADKREILQTPLITQDIIKETISKHIVVKEVKPIEKEIINREGRNDIASFTEV